MTYDKVLIMALSESERARCEKVVAEFIERRRPSPALRAKLDFGFQMQGQSIEILETRPRSDDQNKRIRYAIAKATYIRTKDIWRVYWMGRGFKWRPYRARAAVRTIEEFLAIVEEDKYGHFFE